jgi:hypothetical protein
MQALRCDLRWKVACGLPIDHAGFHPTTLTVCRNRLRVSARPLRQQHTTAKNGRSWTCTPMAA